MAFPPLNPSLARALAEHNYDEPTPVQAAVLEPQTMARDLLVSAQTGSGKTVAYGLAILSPILGGDETIARSIEPAALIVAPTRELALQVQRELAWLYRYVGARVVACVGGMDPGVERRQLATGAQVVVGTPGRLRDHLERGNLQVSNLSAVVLDEADEMLDLGFREDLEFILSTTPAERRTLLFSATLPKGIVALAKQYQNAALRIDVSGSERAHADIEYRAVRVAPNDVGHAVVNLLRVFEVPGALVFCNTREAVRHLQATLSERGFPTVALSGELSQGERNHALLALRSGRARVCVATDVAARGIDLPGLDLVIHAELPHDAEVLKHRSGRTGRAGRKGVSIVLVTPRDRRKAERLLATANIKAEWRGPPTVDEIKQLDVERLMRNPMLTEESGDDDRSLAQSLIAAHGADAVATAFIRLYRSQLPAPEELTDPVEGRDNPRRRDGEARREGPPRRDSGAGRDARPPRDERRKPPREAERFHEGAAKVVWFRLDVGRDKKADPKWILPEICRRGKITKQDVGDIRIYEDETRFEVSEEAAPRFAEAIRNAAQGAIQIEASTEPERSPPPRHAPHAKKAKFHKKKHGKKAD